MMEFTPWRGEEYGASDNYFGKRLLVVGTSFYLRDEDRRMPELFTENLMKKVIERRCKGWKTPFFPRLYFALTGETASQIPSRWDHVWRSISYTVYLHTDELSRPGEKTSRGVWDRAPQILLKTVETLNPDAILMVGKCIAGHFNTVLSQMQRGAFPPLRHVYHPASRQWRKEQARESVKQLLETAAHRCCTADFQ